MKLEKKLQPDPEGSSAVNVDSENVSASNI